MFGLKWKIDIYFDSIGHYISKAYDLTDNSYWTMSPFYFGGYYIQGGQVHEPSENVPCTRFIIDHIIDNIGYGILSIGYEYEIPYDTFFL